MTISVAINKQRMIFVVKYKQMTFYKIYYFNIFFKRTDLLDHDSLLEIYEDDCLFIFITGCSQERFKYLCEMTKQLS